MRRTAELVRPPDQFGPFFGVASCGLSHVTALCADPKSLYGRNFGVHLRLQITSLLL